MWAEGCTWPHRDAASPHMAHVAPQGCTGRHRAHRDAQRHRDALTSGRHRDAGHAGHPQEARRTMMTLTSEWAEHAV
jgi:hypothetical protein